MSRRILFLALVFALLAGCLPRGRADLPHVPTGTPPAAVEAAAQRSADQPIAAAPARPALTALVDLQAYGGPGRRFEPLQELQAGQRVDLVGRNLDNTWLAIASPGDGNGALAWVAAENVVIEGDVDLVAILE